MTCNRLDLDSKDARMSVKGIGILKHAAILLLAAVVLSGCFGKKPPVPPVPQPAKLDLALIASTDLNPDGTGRASPLLVRVYALRSITGFDKADFFSLYEKDVQMLAADLVEREEFILKPGDMLTQSRDYAPDVQFVAVLAAYRDVERSTWRASTAIPAGAKGALALAAGAKSVSLTLEAAARKKKD